MRHVETNRTERMGVGFGRYHFVLSLVKALAMWGNNWSLDPQKPTHMLGGHGSSHSVRESGGEAVVLSTNLWGPKYKKESISTWAILDHRALTSGRNWPPTSDINRAYWGFPLRCHTGQAPSEDLFKCLPTLCLLCCVFRVPEFTVPRGNFQIAQIPYACI